MDKKDLYLNPEQIDNITDYGKGLEPKIDPRTDFGRGISYKTCDGKEYNFTYYERNYFVNSGGRHPCSPQNKIKF